MQYSTISHCHRTYTATRVTRPSVRYGNSATVQWATTASLCELACPTQPPWLLPSASGHCGAPLSQQSTTLEAQPTHETPAHSNASTTVSVQPTTRCPSGTHFFPRNTLSPPAVRQRWCRRTSHCTHAGHHTVTIHRIQHCRGCNAVQHSRAQKQRRRATSRQTLTPVHLHTPPVTPHHCNGLDMTAVPTRCSRHGRIHRQINTMKSQPTK